MKVLVHLHIYYHDQVPFLMEKLDNINGCDWDLVVTCSSKVEETENMIYSRKPNARIYYLENRGYDIWPFIFALKNTKISDYDLVLKIHTKSSTDFTVRINGRCFSGTKWRDLLVNTILGSRNQFMENLSLFYNPNVGLVCNYSLLRTPRGFVPWKKGLLQKEMKRVGIPCLGINKMHYCAGTMFLARMAPYRLIAEADLTPDMFELEQTSHSCNTMSHYYEQIFGYVQEVCGYKIKTISDKLYCPVLKMTNLFYLFLKSIFSLDRVNENEYKYLTLLGVKFKLDDGPKNR